MAAFALIDASLLLNSVDLSDHVRSCQLTLNGVDLNSSAMGPTWESHIGGIKSAVLQIEFLQDFAAANVDDTLWTAFNTQIPFVLRPVKGTAIGATNPEYRGTVLINSYTPIQGEAGALATISVSWPTSGAVTRNIV